MKQFINCDLEYIFQIIQGEKENDLLVCYNYNYNYNSHLVYAYIQDKIVQ